MPGAWPLLDYGTLIAALATEFPGGQTANAGGGVSGGGAPRGGRAAALARVDIRAGGSGAMRRRPGGVDPCRRYRFVTRAVLWPANCWLGPFVELPGVDCSSLAQSGFARPGPGASESQKLRDPAGRPIDRLKVKVVVAMHRRPGGGRHSPERRVGRSRESAGSTEGRALYLPFISTPVIYPGDIYGAVETWAEGALSPAALTAVTT